jgi:predicted nuclease with RNAse H fold
MTWFGADPGGEDCFGIAALRADGSFDTFCCSSVDEAVRLIDLPEAIGIDCPMWWSSGAGGGRRVDSWLRKTYKIRSGTVQAVNSLRGAVTVQGIMLAMRLRERHPQLPITESHPKALLLARGLNRAPWSKITETFNLKGPQPGDMHRRDALLGAVAAREGVSGTWRDLSLDRDPNELDPKRLWFGPVSYWWPPAAVPQA